MVAYHRAPHARSIWEGQVGEEGPLERQLPSQRGVYFFGRVRDATRPKK